MLRTNLSTRPFYNERGVHVVLGLLAVIIAAITLWEASRIVTLSRYNTELSTAIRRDEAEVERLTRQAADVRRGMNRQELATVADAAREANTLIEQRTFSWTAFFNQIEATLPEDVMLVSVRPAIKNEVTHVTMDVIGKRVEAIDAFMQRLESTGAFHQVLARQTTTADDGTHKVTLEAIYTPPPAPAPARAAAPVPQAEKPAAPGREPRAARPGATGPGHQGAA